MRQRARQAYTEVLYRFGNVFTLSEVLRSADINYPDDDITGGFFGLAGHLPDLLMVAKTGGNVITTGEMPVGLFPRQSGALRTLGDFYPVRMRELDPANQPDMIVLHRWFLYAYKILELILFRHIRARILYVVFIQ